MGVRVRSSILLRRALLIGTLALLLAAASAASPISASALDASTETTSASAETTAPAPSTTPTPTAVFAHSSKWRLDIHFPSDASSTVAVGFHQASNRKAFRLVPTMRCLRIQKSWKTRAMLAANRALKLFQQPLRGRGSSNFSAADCSMPPRTVVLAPTSGVVTAVKRYKLEGRINDLRLEIRPDGASRARVCVLHIQNVSVRVGDRVVGGVTPIASVRHLKLRSTIDRFVPRKPVDHVHIQINDSRYKHAAG